MFYQFDGNLLRFPISPSAKLCYMVLSARLEVSKINGWQDNGGYYVLYSHQKMAETLGLHKRRVIYIFEELEKAELIHTVHFMGQSNRIYIKPVPIPEHQTQDAIYNLEDEIRAAGHAERITLEQAEVDEIISRVIPKLPGVANRTGYLRKTVRNFRREKINGQKDIPDTTYDLSEYEMTNAIIEEGY